MHIMDGILSWPVVSAGFLFTAAGASWGLSKLREEDMPKTACMASAFFAASLVHVPIGPSSAHLLLNGLAGLILGPAAFPAILVGLALQAALFQFGGFKSLGVNAFDMGFPAILCWLALGAAARRSQGWLSFATGFGAGFAGVFLSCLFTALALAFSGGVFSNAAALLFVAHAPVAIVEGLVSGFALVFLKKASPAIFEEKEIVPC